MKTFLIVVGILAALAALGYFVIRCIHIVPQSQNWILERFGKCRAVWQPGLHFKIPVIERIVSKVSMKERALDFTPQGVITKDNVMMQIDSVVFMQVVDAKKFTYGVDNPIVATENLVATTLRNVVGTMTLDDSLTSREQINTNLMSILNTAVEPWGITFRRVEVKSITPPEDIRDAMTKQMKAEREKRQTILEANAHKEAVMTRAEGDKQAEILKAQAERDAKIARAEGEAKRIKLVYEAEAEGVRMLNEAKASKEVLSLKGMEALQRIADGNATKIFMPTEIGKAVALAGIFGETAGIGDATPIGRKQNVPAAKSDECCDDSEKSSVTQEIVRGET